MAIDPGLFNPCTIRPAVLGAKANTGKLLRTFSSCPKLILINFEYTAIGRGDTKRYVFGYDVFD